MYQHQGFLSNDDSIGVLVDPLDDDGEIWFMFLSSLRREGLKINEQIDGVINVTLGHWAIKARLQIHRYRCISKTLVPITPGHPDIPIIHCLLQHWSAMVWIQRGWWAAPTVSFGHKGGAVCAWRNTPIPLWPGGC